MKAKPFHDSIVDAIGNVHGPNEEAIPALTIIGRLIINTKIPKNHQVIAYGFKQAIEYWGDGRADGLLSEVLEKLTAEENTLASG